MKFIGRWFEKILSHLKCRAFACGIKNSVINEIGQNGIYVEFEIIFIPNLTAGFVQLQSIVNVLEKEISPMVKLLLVVIKPPVCMKCYLDRFFGLFFFVLFSFKLGFFACPSHNIIACGPMFF